MPLERISIASVTDLFGKFFFLLALCALRLPLHTSRTAHCPSPPSHSLVQTYPLLLSTPRPGQIPSTASLKRLIASMWPLGEDRPAFIVLTEISVAPKSFHFVTSLTHSSGERLPI